MTIGDRVFWCMQPRGGFGFILYIPCTIMKFIDKKALVEFSDASGGYESRLVGKAALWAPCVSCQPIILEMNRLAIPSNNRGGCKCSGVEANG